ncbi:MAG: HAMP domain-containing protein [Methanospirillum sp.]
MFSPIGAFAAFLLSSYFLFYQSTLSSIAALQQGTAIVGSGNLAYVLPEARDDEIGELAQSLNRMTADLRAVTASRTDLEQEVAHRKAAEARPCMSLRSG